MSQSPTVMSFNTLWITSVIGKYFPFGSRPVIKPKSFMKLINLGIFAFDLSSQTDAVWQPDWYAPSTIGEITVAAIISNS